MKIMCSNKIDVAALNAYFHNSDSYASRLDIEILEITDSYAIASMPLTDVHRNGMGNAHGGAVYSLVDMAFAAAAHATGEFFVTAQASITYLEPGKIGPLKAVAETVRCGKTLGTFEVRVFDSDETLVAISTVTGYNTRVSVENALQK